MDKIKIEFIFSYKEKTFKDTLSVSEWTLDDFGWIGKYAEVMQQSARIDLGLCKDE